MRLGRQVIDQLRRVGGGCRERHSVQQRGRVGEAQVDQVGDGLYGNTHLFRDVLEQFGVLLGHTAVGQHRPPRAVT